MIFKTSEQIRAEKEMAGKSSKKEEAKKQKIADKANQKYARLAEEAEKREAARKKAAEAKPKLVVRRDIVIETPALLASEPKKTKGPVFMKALKKAVDKANDKAIKEAIDAESKFYGGKPVPKLEPKQVWDDVAKKWVKP